MNTSSATNRLPLRDLERLAHILRVVSANGWGHYAQRLRQAAHLPQAGGEAAGEAATGLSDGERLRRVLEELGPTFVKFGQMLSLRQDLFDESIIQSLSQLQDQVAFFPSETARQIVEEELQAPVDKLFATFDMSPLAAASMAQVHTATLFDGTPVIVKVQRPSAEALVRADLEILFFLARLLQAHVPETRQFDPIGLVDEFSETITKELDFRREGQSADRFRETLAPEPDVDIPKIYWNRSTRRVLTMDLSPGLKIDTAHPTTQDERQVLAKRLLQLYLIEVFEHGFFHGDPHPGNVFIETNGRLCFHDFGIMGQLGAKDQENLRQMFLALIARDASWLAEVYLRMGGAPAGIDRAAFARDMGESLEQYYAAAAQTNTFSEIIRQFLRLSQHYRIRVPRQYLLAFKAFILTESLARTLDEHFDTLAALRGYAPRMVWREMMPGWEGTRSLESGYRALSSLRQQVTGLPEALDRALALLQQGEVALRLPQEQLDEMAQHIDRASNRRSLSLVIASIVIGSSIVTVFHAGPHYQGIPILGLIGYLIATVLGLCWAIAILRSGKF